jgi:hypothetical protein
MGHFGGPYGKIWGLNCHSVQLIILRRMDKQKCEQKFGRLAEELGDRTPQPIWDKLYFIAASRIL